MKKLFCIFIVTLLSAPLFPVHAGESLFGVTNNSIGLVQHPYASAGKARSYEVAHMDSLMLNYRNFASWTDIAYTIFSIRTGYSGALSDTKEKSTYIDNANFQGGILAFPIYKKHLVFGFGVLPYTFINQRIEDEYTLTDEDIDVFQSLVMKGGLSRAMANFSVKLISGYRLGIGYEYTFGNITQNLVKELRENTTSSILVDYDYRYAGNGVVISAMGNPLDNWALGLVFRPSVKLNSKRVIDSASEELNREVEGDLTLPAEFSLGLEYTFSSAYIAGLEFMYQDWKNGFKRNGSRDPSQELLYRIGGGIERKPSKRLFVDLAQRIAYRLGFFYGQLNYQSGNEPVNEYGLSMGISLPIQRFQSGIDFAAVVGRRGSLSQNGLEETFISFDVTINASEIWFRNRED